MDIILIGFSITILGVSAALILFTVAMRSRNEDTEPQPVPDTIPTAEKFFFEKPLPHSKAFPRHTSKEILARLEVHFRSEEQAATSFLNGPTIESLHHPSGSTLWSQGKGP